MSGAYTYASDALLCISSLLLPELLWVTHALERHDRWVVILKIKVLNAGNKMHF
jgi:hypothetical protein